MAYTATVLQDAIYKAAQTDKFQSAELRKSSYGALEAAMASTNLLLPKTELERIRQAATQTEKINTFVREADGIGTSRKCSGSGTGTSAQTTVSWTTLVEEFKISFAETQGNQYTYQEIFNNRFDQKLRSLYNRIDALVVAQLEASYSAGAGTYYTNFNNAKQVPLSDHDISNNRAALWVNRMMAEMMQNDFNDDIVGVGDAFLKANTMAMLNQGQGTATNLGFQFSGTNWNFTNRVTNNTGRDATAYIFQNGMIGLLNWIRPEYTQGVDIGTDVWSRFTDPVYGMNFELKMKKQCEDNSLLFSGAEADYTESFVIAADFATPTAYSSTSNSFIYKYELENDNNIQSGSGSYS